MMAEELGFDGAVARRAGSLHDIANRVDQEMTYPDEVRETVLRETIEYAR